MIGGVNRGWAMFCMGVACAALTSCGQADSTPENGANDPATVSSPTAKAWFTEEATARGLDFLHESGHDERNLFPEIIAGGVALFDMDRDGDLDAYLVQSGTIVDPGTAAGRNRLFRNNGAGQFEDVTDGSGAGDPGYGMGVTVGDYNGDGWADLYVTNVGLDRLLRNRGDGTFEDVTESSGLLSDSWGTSAAFVDYDRDGDLDLFVTNYVNWSLATEQDCYNNAGALDYCLPTNYNSPATDRMFRNNGDGSFTERTRELGFQLAFGNGLGVVANDYDGDGWVDLFVANDTMKNQLWMNQQGRGFRDEALLRGCALDEHGQAKAGMGVASEDIDDDGDTDLLVVNLQGQTDSYYRNDGGSFSDQTGRIGLGQASRFHTRFGIGFVDFDHDGRYELFEANGRVTKDPGSPEDPFSEPNVLFTMGPDGRFIEVEPQGGVEPSLIATSRGAAFGDVDGDGDVDVLIANMDERPHLLINQMGQPDNAIVLTVLETSGADALGARLTFTQDGVTKTRFVRSAYSYCASSDPRVHVGLGDASGIEQLVVQWSDGTEQAFGAFSAGARETLQRSQE